MKLTSCIKQFVLLFVVSLVNHSNGYQNTGHGLKNELRSTFHNRHLQESHTGHLAEAPMHADGPMEEEDISDLENEIPDCVLSTMEGYLCMAEALGGDYNIHWTVEDDGVSFACESTGSGWVGIGWPETPGLMVGAQAVIGLGGDENTVLTYLLESKIPTGIVEDDSLFEIQDTSIENSDESSVLKFKRLFDDVFDGEGEIDFIVAFHRSANNILYHGPTKGSVTVALS